MKVLHVLYALRPSGMEKMLYDSAEFWKANDIQSDILANDDEEGPFAAALQEKGYRIVCIPWRESRRHLVDFYKLIKREQFDVVHVHPIRGYLGFFLVAKLAGVSKICKTFHSVFYATDSCRYVWHFLQRKMLSWLHVDSFSPGISVQQNEWKYYHHRTHLIWNWVDEMKFNIFLGAERDLHRRYYDIFCDKWVIVSVGNCHCEGHREVKNHQLILRAIAQLAPELKAKLLYLHVGQEMEDYPERALAKELGIEGCVRFMGSCDNIHDILSCADLFVMSSKREGLPVSVIEALLSGIPVLLTRVHGLQDFGEIIPHINYTDLTPATMVKKIEELMQTDQNELRGKAKESAVSARQYFSVEGSCSKLLAFYRGEAK